MKNSPIYTKSITINDESFTLGFLTEVTGRHDSGYILLNGNPVVSISFAYGEPSMDHIRRASMAIQSYRNNGGKYSQLPSLAYGFFDNISPSTEPPKAHYENQPIVIFDMKMLDDPKTNVEPFDYFTPHLTVSTTLKDKNGSPIITAFDIWDREMIRKIAKRYNKNKVGSRFRERIDSDTEGFHSLLAGI